MKLSEYELSNLQGGAITAALLNSVARVLNTVLELGRTVGSSIRRIYSKNYC